MNEWSLARRPDALDLKPGNVMVTADGRVKVLDFGLAKVAGARGSEDASSELPTEVETREGVVTRVCWELAYRASWQSRLDDAVSIATRGLESAGEGPGVGRRRLLAILVPAAAAATDARLL